MKNNTRCKRIKRLEHRNRQLERYLKELPITILPDNKQMLINRHQLQMISGGFIASDRNALDNRTLQIKPDTFIQSPVSVAVKIS